MTLSDILLQSALLIAGQTPPAELAEPGGYHPGLTKLLKVRSSTPIWGPAIQTPSPGGTHRYQPPVEPLGKTTDRPSMTSTPGTQSHGSGHSGAIKEERIVQPGGHHPGLTKLLRVDSSVRIWGPGISTPAPGGEIFATAETQK